MILGFGNNVVSALAGDITTSQTNIPVMPGTGAKFAKLLSADFENKSNAQRVYAKITLTDNKESAFEICHLVSVNGDVLNVIRGQEGTTPKGWFLNDVVANFATRGSENHFVQIAQLQSGHYVSGVAGGTANALTLELPATFFVNGGTDWALRTPLIVYPTQNNTGNATLQLTMGGRVLGTFPLLKGNKSQLTASDIIKDVPLMCVLDSTKSYFSVLNPLDIYLGSQYLRKDQNGADIPNKALFVKNIGAARAYSGAVSIGGDSGNWTTAAFIAWLESQGAFNHPYWMCKGSWAYANNKVITDTGCGNICLAGAVVEVMGVRSAMTIRVTTPSTTTGGGLANALFTYVNHGDNYSPGWRRELIRAGDSMTGKLTLPQTSSFGINTNNGLGGNSIAIGDSDTGIKQNGDGVLDVYANNAHVMRFSNSSIQSNKVLGIGTSNGLGGNSIAIGDTDTGLKQNGDGILDIYANSQQVFRFSTGSTLSNKPLTVSGNSVATGEMQSGNGSARLATDGNVYGSAWGGWLSNYIQNRTGVQDVRLGAQITTPRSSLGSESFTWVAGQGYVCTGLNVKSGGGKEDEFRDMYSRPIQKLINGTWYNVTGV